MGTMGASMAGSMAGSMIGNTLFGGGSRSEAPAAVESSAPQGQMGGAPQGGPVCHFESQQFLQCMSETQDDLTQCTHLFDAFKHCNAQVQYQ